MDGLNCGSTVISILLQYEIHILTGYGVDILICFVIGVYHLSHQKFFVLRFTTMYLYIPSLYMCRHLFYQILEIIAGGAIMSRVPGEVTKEFFKRFTRRFCGSFRGMFLANSVITYSQFQI